MAMILENIAGWKYPHAVIYSCLIIEEGVVNVSFFPILI